MKRFEALWAAWDEGVSRGRDPATHLPLLSDEDLVELLAGAPESRRAERNIFATETLNRLNRARRALVAAALSVSDDMESILRTVEEQAQQAGERDALGGATPGYDERNAARESAIEHIQLARSMAALERASSKLSLLSKDALARARDPEMYVDARE